MPEYLSPGVYVEEYDSGAVPMAGVGTSTAGFVGMAQRGSVCGRPQFITSFADYKRLFGGYLGDAKYGDKRFLPYAVEQFFINGGARAYVMRVAPSDAKCAAATLGALKLEAANPGEWGNRIRVSIAPVSKAKTHVVSVNGAELTLQNSDGFNAGDVVELFDGKAKTYATVLSVIDSIATLDKAAPAGVADTAIGTAKYVKTCEIELTVRCDDAEEAYGAVSFNPECQNFIGAALAKSGLIRASVCEKKAAIEVKPAEKPADKADDKAEKPVEKPAYAAPKPEGITPFERAGGSGAELTAALAGGSEGTPSKIAASDYIGSDDGPGKRTGLQAFIETTDVSLMAIPGVTEPAVQAALVAQCEGKKSCFAVLDVPIDRKKPAEVIEHRDMFDSTYAAMYHPWLEMFDPLSKRNEFMPPSGAVLGIYARTDTDRGVHKAPANEVVRGCTGLSCSYNEGEQDILNPQGVNLIRAFAGRGIRVWGARTLSSNGLWKYVNVRRLFIFVEESIKANTNWVVFEPNSEALWSRVQRSVEMFLATVWRDGALAGTTPAEAFFVEIGKTTMSADDIENGRLICNIGIAPVKPAEFVVFRITQHTAAK